jgi:hypothetical protein
MTKSTDSTIRKILNNEIAQIISICVALWFFVVNVILPIAEIRSQLSNIQVTLSDMKATNSGFDTRITSNSNNILVLQQEFNNFKK